MPTLVASSLDSLDTMDIVVLSIANHALHPTNGFPDPMAEKVTSAEVSAKPLNCTYTCIL